MRIRRVGSWSVAGRLGSATLFLSNFFLHKPISNLCDALSRRFGFAAFNRGALLAIAVPSALAIAALLLRSGRWRRRAAAALALAAMSIAAHRWLLVANVELIHLPQYALLTGLLLTGGLSAGSAWLVGTACGVLDEIYQHLVIYAANPATYLDYNDMLLNVIGVTWAVCVLVDRQPPAERADGCAAPGSRWIGTGLVLAAVAGLVLRPPELSPFLRHAATGRTYRVLSPGEALAFAALLWRLASVTIGQKEERPSTW